MEIFEIQLENSIGPVKLGMTETEVSNVIGAPDYIYGHRHHFLDGLMVDFDNEGRVEFIEAAASELFSTTLFGIDVHRTFSNAPSASYAPRRARSCCSTARHTNSISR